MHTASPRGFRRYGLAVGSVALAVGILELLGPGVNAPIAAQVLLLVLIIAGSRFGRGPAIAASFGAAAGFSRYFITPEGLAYGDRGDWAQLISFIILAVVVGELAARAERRAREAQAGRQEIARLYQQLESAARRADAQPPDAAHLDQGLGDRAHPPGRRGGPAA